MGKSLRFFLRFWGHRRWLRATMFTFTLFTVIVRFHVLGIVEGPKTKPYRGCTDIVQRLYGGRREIVRFLRGYSNIFTEIVHRSCDSVQRLCEDRKVKVSSLNATYTMCLRGYDLTIWKICITRAKQNRRGYGDPLETVNPYEIVQSSYTTAGRSCD